MFKGLARSGAWVALDNVSAAVLAFAFFVVTARLLTPEQFGIAALALSVTQILQPLVDSLFHDAIVQRSSLRRADYITATTFCLLWSLVLAFALCCLSPTIARALSTPELSRYLPWMSLCLVSGGLSAVAAAKARRELEFRRLAVRTAVGRTAGMAVGFWLAWNGYGVWSIVVQAITSSLIASGLLLAGTGLALGRISWESLKPLLAFAAPTVGTQVLLYSNSRIATLIIGSALGPTGAGVWSVAFRFVEPIQALLATTIGQFCLPLFARYQSDTAIMAQYFRSTTRAIAIALVPIFLGLAVCAHRVILVFVGDQWIEAAPLMRVVCVVTMLTLLRQPAEIVLTSRGRPGYTFYTQAVAGLLSIAGVAANVGVNLMSAGLGWALRVIPFFTLNVYFVRRDLGIPARAQLSEVARPVVAGVAMALTLYSLEQTAFAGLSALSGLLAMIAAGVVVYCAAVLAIDSQARLFASAMIYRRTAV